MVVEEPSGLFGLRSSASLSLSLTSFAFSVLKTQLRRVVDFFIFFYFYFCFFLWYVWRGLRHRHRRLLKLSRENHSSTWRNQKTTRTERESFNRRNISSQRKERKMEAELTTPSFRPRLLSRRRRHRNKKRKKKKEKSCESKLGRVLRYPTIPCGQLVCLAEDGEEKRNNKASPAFFFFFFFFSSFLFIS